MDTVEYQKRCVKREFERMIEIMQLYYKIARIHEFVLDLQIYNDSRGTEPRVWLSAPDNHLGIKLMLYSVKLDDSEGIVPNERAVEVFSEYMAFYANNKELFELWHKESDNYKPIAEIKFKITNR